MAVIRVQVDCDRATARRVWEHHRAGKVHRGFRDAARDEVWRLGRTPAGEPVFVGVSSGDPVRLLYDAPVCRDSTA